jgi:predicted 2-oxoglutarate/Fe(II)-dependent dioxygenase YbiX
MKDTFDLTKFLKENKSLENLNPTFKSLNEEESREERADVDKYEYEKGKKAGMKAKIREYILSELELDIDDSDKTDAELNADYDPVYEGGELEFCGRRATENEDVLLTEFKQPNILGNAIIHSGRQLHRVNPVTSGERYQLIFQSF